MPKRQEEEESEWMSRKEDILALYVEQDKPLSEVMHVMARQGFERTKSQYERSFKRWRISKNVRKEEWDFILGRLNGRNRPTNVKVRGVVIPQARLERQRLRKRETTFDSHRLRLHPQSRSRTPPEIEISTPPPAAERHFQELSKESERDEHLDEGVSPAVSPQEPLVQAQEDDRVLSPTVTAVTVAAVPEVSDHIATKMPLEATRTPSPSSDLVSNTTPRSCSELLCDYMRSAICVIENELPNHIPLSDKCGMRHLVQQPTRDLLNRWYESLLLVFIRYTTPKDDLYNVVRAFDTADDLVFLGRLLLIAKSAAKWKWTTFFENLLLYAAEDGNECLVVMLLDGGVYVHFSPPYRHMRCLNNYPAFNALQIAVRGGYQNLINILTSHGATIFSGYRNSDVDFFFDAITRNTIDFAKPLLAKAATSNIRTYHRGIEVFSLAVEQSYDEIIDLLLDAGFNPFDAEFKSDSKSDIQLFCRWREHSASAFMAAVKGSKTRYLEKFVKFPHDDLDKEQCKERLQQLTAGYVFSRCSANINLMNAILDTGWHPDDVKLVSGYDYVQKCLYDTLAKAARSGNYSKVDRLIQMGASPNCPQDTKARSYTVPPLHQAIRGGSVPIVRQLIAAGAYVNPVDILTLTTPLEEAVPLENLEILSLLVEARVEINRRDGWDGGTAIETASDSGYLEVVAYLLESGANIQGRHNTNYRRSLFKAQRNKHVHVVDLLQEWKRSKYGEHDCDTIDNIIRTMTQDELDGVLSDTESTMDSTDEE